MDINALVSIATQMRKSFPSFGGVMMWDASQAYGVSIDSDSNEDSVLMVS